MPHISAFCEVLTYSQEKNIKKRHVWHYTAPTGLYNLAQGRALCKWITSIPQRLCKGLIIINCQLSIINYQLWNGFQENLPRLFVVSKKKCIFAVENIKKCRYEYCRIKRFAGLSFRNTYC